MKIYRAGIAILVGSMVFTLAACIAPMITQTAESTKDTVAGFIPSGDLQTHAVRSIKQVKVDRIAVMPIVADPGSDVVADGGPEAVTAEVYMQAASAGGWDVVAQDDVSKAMASMPPTTPADIDQNALALGRAVSVDGVLYGKLERYKEREGIDYAAQSPASVVFSLSFVDMQSKEVVWTAKFAKSQEALSQNIFELANFVQHEGRWVRANEIAMEGVTKAVANLHGDLNLEKNVNHFETGTYGKLKSGQQRYSAPSGGIF
jgi:hypothetical protein